MFCGGRHFVRPGRDHGVLSLDARGVWRVHADEAGETLVPLRAWRGFGWVCLLFADASGRHRGFTVWQSESDPEAWRMACVWAASGLGHLAGKAERGAA